MLLSSHSDEFHTRGARAVLCVSVWCLMLPTAAQDHKQEAQQQRAPRVYVTNDIVFVPNILGVRQGTNLHEEAGGDCLADVVVVLRAPELGAVLLQLHIHETRFRISTDKLPYLMVHALRLLSQL
jgi:hypothetical protein